MNKIVSDNQLISYSVRLRKIRLEKKYTLESLAKMVNSNKQTLWNIENKAYKSVNIGLLNALAKNLYCTTDYLLGLSEDPHKTAPKDGQNGSELIIPITFDHPAASLTTRLIDLCGTNIDILSKIVTYLEIAPAKHKKLLEVFLDAFIKMETM